MNKQENTLIAKACASVNMFQYYYADVRADGITLTFAIHERDIKEQVALDIAPLPFFTRSYELLTGNVTTTYDSNYDPLVIAALRLHFNEHYCKTEGLTTLQDYLKGGSGELEQDPTYGQATFYSDLEELDIGDGATILPGRSFWYDGRTQVDV